CGALPTGSGFVRCAHGRLPVPAPATAELLGGFPVAASDLEAELTTPTGAAILTTLAARFGRRPAMTVETVGLGAGTQDFDDIPNLLRVFLGETADVGDTDRVWVLETNIDDMSAELFETLFERLLELGALDVFTTPVQMKKNRPAVMLSTLVPAALRSRAEEIIFRETTTFGIRAHEVERRKLRRESVTVKTGFGELRVKLGRLGDALVTVSPEYDDCRRAAREHDVPLKDVYESARRAARDLE
ncbi:MAG TPA: LarC family nickel insertion protein, partial [Planctomycetota bacterium]|nr:LarC family nickel insertion protein [Planctomycetota bacterium]